MNNKLKKILICGLGSIGRRYLRVINKNWPNLDIAVLRSGNGPKCEEEKLINFKTSNFNESIDWKPDAAIICSPANMHIDQAISLGKAKIPCLIEKPLGIGNESHQKFKTILELSNSVPMLVGYILRHDPCASIIKNKLDENILGKVIEADFHCGSWLPKWRPEINYLQSVSANKELGGGVLLELSHEIDIANWFLGPIHINYANLQSSGLFPINVEDRAYLIAQNKYGAQISIRVNFCSEPSTRKIIIRGEKGQIYWDLILGKLEISNDKDLIFEYETIIDRDRMFFLQIQHFWDCIYFNKKPLCSVLEGKYVLELVQEAKEIYQISNKIS